LVKGITDGERSFQIVFVDPAPNRSQKDFRLRLPMPDPQEKAPDFRPGPVLPPRRLINI
jgi:hypothetical protein